MPRTINPLSLVKSLVAVGIVGVPLRSAYAPVVATVANPLTLAAATLLATTPVSSLPSPLK